ncbi:MAG: PVC-type heme-binding CxxCH protein, partial [Phycisphaerae bacterium]
TADGIPFYDPSGQGPRAGGGKWNKMQTPLAPAESVKHLRMPEGFEARLFVAEPQVVKPITMNWDERGRLWVVESIDYPNRITDTGKGSDRIKVCEDTDGDGLADKFTVFAEGLNIPTTLTFANGGVIVMERKSTWFLKDTDGDGKADVKKELFTGWYRGLDTHAGPSNLQYGFDNWIYGMLGYAGFAGEVGGKRFSFSQGFYRFKPDGSQLEFLRSTNNNTWGIGFRSDGVLFGSTANGNPSTYLPISNRYYEGVRGWAPRVLEPIADTYKFQSHLGKIRQVDWHDGYTAAAGHALYTARAFPKGYWDRVAFVTEPTGHLVGAFVLDAVGSHFKSRNAFNLLASDDEWCAPIMAEVGPDSALWVIDWYNYIVQHNPTPVGFKTGAGAAYETPRRDKEHGRIYRIVYTSSDVITKPVDARIDLSKASPAQLVEALKNDNLFWRRHAQRLLVERNNKDVVPALVELTKDTMRDEIGVSAGPIHALWTLQGLGALDEATAAAALKHPATGVRRNALLTMPRTEAGLAALLESKITDDADPQVRLAALLTIADMPASPALEDRTATAILGVLGKPQNQSDKWIPDAAVAAGAKHDAAFLRTALVASKGRAAPPTAPEPAPAVAAPATPVDVVVNGSAEAGDAEKPEKWRPVSYGGGDVKQTVDAAVARDGARSLKLESARGTDASWSQDVTVKPNTRYRLTAWVKTKNVKPVGGAVGALLNVHQLQRDNGGATKGLAGDHDWTLLATEFATGSNRRVTVNCLLGGWGRATGEAWYDDVRVTELGAARGGSLATSLDDGADKVAQVTKLITRHYAERGPADSVVATLAAVTGAERTLAAAVLDGLVAGWPAGSAPKLSDADRNTIVGVTKSLPANDRDRLLVLFNRWGDKALLGGQLEEALKSVTAQLADATKPTADRIEAARRLIRLADTADTIKAVLAQVTPQAAAELSTGLIGAVGESREDAAGAAVVAKWAELSPASRKAAVAVLMRRTPWTLAMLNAVKDKKMLRGDLTASDWQILKLAKDREVVALAKQLDAAAMDPDRQKVLAKFLPALATPGDAAAGAKTFTALCAQCHTMGGQGGKVGPTMDGVGARDPKEILADIVDPNRSVEANYRLWNIETTEDDTISGRLDTETETSVELMDATGQRHVVQRKEIKSMSVSTLSIMPVGLIDPLPPKDVADLMAYLAKSTHK